MALNADMLLERIHLKNQARRWRLVAIIIAIIAAIVFFEKMGKLNNFVNIQSHIARFEIDEIIFDEPKRLDLLDEIKDDDSIKALILRIDSPGGTTVGSEALYLKLREIAAKKPVVATLRSMATSGGYMAAIGADYILAREGTITGSVGVIMQSAEMTELAEKLGIKPIVVRSGALKASPTPFEKLTPDVREMLDGVIQDFFDYFIGLVAERRQLTPEQIAYISDGRVVSTRQALNAHLIDAIGGESEAKQWLEKNHEIAVTLDVRDYEVPEEKSAFKEIFDGAVAGTIFENLNAASLDGLVSIWHPTALK